jgi:hypothetical protein
VLYSTANVTEYRLHYIMVTLHAHEFPFQSKLIQSSRPSCRDPLCSQIWSFTCLYIHLIITSQQHDPIISWHGSSVSLRSLPLASINEIIYLCRQWERELPHSSLNPQETGSQQERDFLSRRAKRAKQPRPESFRLCPTFLVLASVLLFLCACVCRSVARSASYMFHRSPSC